MTTSYLMSSHRDYVATSSVVTKTYSWVEDKLNYATYIDIVGYDLVVYSGSIGDYEFNGSPTFDNNNKTITVSITTRGASGYSQFDIFVCFKISFDETKYRLNNKKIYGCDNREVDTYLNSYKGLFYPVWSSYDNWASSSSLTGYKILGNPIIINKEGTNPSYNKSLIKLQECSAFLTPSTLITSIIPVQTFFQLHKLGNYLYLYKFTLNTPDVSPTTWYYTRSNHRIYSPSDFGLSIIPTRLIVNIQGGGGKGGENWRRQSQENSAGGGGGSGAFSSIVINTSKDWIFIIGYGNGNQPSGISSNGGFSSACYGGISLKSTEYYISFFNTLSNCQDYLICSGGKDGTQQEKIISTVNYTIGIGGSGGVIDSKNTNNYWYSLYNFSGKSGGNGGYYFYASSSTQEGKRGISSIGTLYSTTKKEKKIIPSNQYSYNCSGGEVASNSGYYPASGGGGSSIFPGGDGGNGGRNGSNSNYIMPLDGSYGSGGGGMIIAIDTYSNTPYVGYGGNGVIELLY